MKCYIAGRKVELEKVAVNNWNVVMRDEYDNICKVERECEYYSAYQTKKEWIKELKQK